MMQIEFNFNNFVFYGVCLRQLDSVPAAYAVVAGGCDWPLPSAVSLPITTSVPLRPLRPLRCVGWKARLTYTGVDRENILVQSLVLYHQPHSMFHLWTNVGLYWLFIYSFIKRLIAYITTKTSGILPRLNLSRCLLDQSRFTVLPSPAAASNNSDLVAAANHSSVMYMNRQRGH